MSHPGSILDCGDVGQGDLIFYFFLLYKYCKRWKHWRRNRVGHVGQWPTHFFNCGGLAHPLFQLWGPGPPTSCVPFFCFFVVVFLLVTTEVGHVGGLPPTCIKGQFTP